MGSGGETSTCPAKHLAHGDPSLQLIASTFMLNTWSFAPFPPGQAKRADIDPASAHTHTPMS